MVTLNTKNEIETEAVLATVLFLWDFSLFHRLSWQGIKEETTHNRNTVKGKVFLMITFVKLLLLNWKQFLFHCWVD